MDDTVWTDGPVPGPETGDEEFCEALSAVVLGYGERYAAVPVLVAEIVSPSSVGIDRLLKRDVYARLGVAHYWIVDLDEPSVTVLDLYDGTYRERTVARGEQLLDIDEPFTVSFRPTDLMDLCLWTEGRRQAFARLAAVLVVRRPCHELSRGGGSCRCRGACS